MSKGQYIPSTYDVAADHVERYLATDGADGYDFHGAVCVILTTKGRRTGAIRRSPIVRVRDGGRYLAVASMGGAPKHPLWYLNLLADPEVTIQDKGEVHHLIARTATPAEKEELWPVAVAEWPDYENYQLRTERDIPLVICEYPS
ncbi:MAG: nitroreductase family deazaflavin-dependent oxidoreductase [Acidimicrobiales bacterium]|tara:strand:- start:2478 stop:2912 length:435 start_codon:yes stop_codon:yes gene_type:complete